MGTTDNGFDKLFNYYTILRVQLIIGLVLSQLIR